MLRRLDAATNCFLLFSCVLVSGFLIRDRVIPHIVDGSVEAGATAPFESPTDIHAPLSLADMVSGLGPDITPMLAKKNAATSDVAAVFTDGVLTVRQLEILAGSQLQAMRAQEDLLKRDALDRAIDRVLLQREAKRRGISLEELIRVEIVDEAARFEPTRHNSLPDPTRSPQKSRLRAFTRELRSRAGVQVLLPTSRVPVEASTAATRGPARAPITIIEFSDFQCPFCARSQATLKQLDEEYPGKIRLVFRHFPLPIHKDATIAAEASECARDQGRFWELHDALFALPSVTAKDVAGAAQAIGIDMVLFNNCVASGRQRAIWQRDKIDGERYGVSSTPTFFVNGRMVVGAQSIETLAAIVNEELDYSHPQSQ